MRPVLYFAIVDPGRVLRWIALIAKLRVRGHPDLKDPTRADL
jgi:hypothetical protein